MAAAVGGRQHRDIDIAGSVNSQAGRMVKPGGERALGAIRREFGDRMFVSHEEITGSVAGWAGESQKRLGNDERSLHSFGREFEKNRIPLKNKEITRTIKGGYSIRADPLGERTPLSVGREFENRALRVVHDEKIPFTIKAQTKRGQPRG